MSACTSFGKQLPPYHIPAWRNFDHIRESLPSIFEISSILAPTFSQKFAISFIKLSLVARKALAAYLDTSLEAISVKIIFV